MKTTLFHLSAILLAVISFNADAIAQETTDTTPAKGKTMRVICFGAENTQLVYANGKEMLPLQTPVGSISGAQTQPSGNVLKIFRADQIPPQGAATAGPQAPVPLGIIELPSAKKLLVVLILPSQPNAKIQGRAFVDSPTSHSKAQARVFNLSPKPIVAKFGSDVQKFGVGEEGVMPFKGNQDEIVQYQIGVQENGSNKISAVDGGIYPTSPTIRAFSFVVEYVVPDTKEKMTVARTILEDVEDNASHP